MINNGAEWQSINIGFLLALVSAIFLAFDTIIGRSLRNYPYEVVSFYNQAFGLVFLVSLALLTFELPSASLIKDVTLLLIPASIIGGASSMLYYFSLRQLEATWVGLITPLQVVVASLFAFLFFQEIPSSAVVSGGFLIIMAVCNLVLFPNGKYISITDRSVRGENGTGART